VFDFQLLVNECARHRLQLPAASPRLLCLDTLKLARGHGLKELLGLPGLKQGQALRCCCTGQGAAM
jgi:hypothetical protein